MNNTTKLALIVAAAILAPGCETTPDNNDIDRNAIIIKTLMYEGTAHTMIQRPEYRREFEIVRSGLDLAIAADTLTAAKVVGFVQKLKINEIESPEGRLIITSASIILVTSLSQIEIDETKAYALRAYASAIRDGISKGLAYSTNLTADSNRPVYASTRVVYSEPRK